MNYQNDDLRIKEINELLPVLRSWCVLRRKCCKHRCTCSQSVCQILKGDDDRLLVVIGPCSIHVVCVACEYAARLLTLRVCVCVMCAWSILKNRAPPSAGKGSSTIPIWITASASTTGCVCVRACVCVDINDSGLPVWGISSI